MPSKVHEAGDQVIRFEPFGSHRRDSFSQVSVGIDTDARYSDKVPAGRCDHHRRIFRGRPSEELVSSAVLASLH